MDIRAEGLKQYVQYTKCKEDIDSILASTTEIRKELYLPLDVIVDRSIIEESTQTNIWRDPLLCINLVRMLGAILVDCNGGEGGEDQSESKRRKGCLGRINAHFAERLTSKRSSLATLMFYLALSAQRFIADLENTLKGGTLIDQNGAVKALDNIFGSKDGYNVLKAVANKIAGMLEDGNAERRVWQKHQELKKIVIDCPGNLEISDLGRFKKEFAWEKLEVYARDYCCELLDELLTGHSEEK